MSGVTARSGSGSSSNDDDNSSLVPPLSKTSFDMKGRVFLITGGTQGLGLQIARQLKACGATGLVLISRNQKRGNELSQELTDAKCRCHFVRADLGNAEEAQGVVDKALAKLSDGPPPDCDSKSAPVISGVVNAAAITERGNLLTTTPDQFDQQIAVNLRAPFLISQAVAKHMINRGVKGGSIVNICSCAAYGGAPFVMAYSVAKAGLVTLTKNNAAELAPHSIRVNGINMGWCLTDNEDKLQTKQSNDPRWYEKADAGCPMGRILRPQDVAGTVLFLLSDASVMMTGSIIDLHPEFANGMLSLLAVDERNS